MDTTNQDVRRTYFYIRDDIHRNGIAPSIREIAENCFVSRATVMQHLAILEAWGYIERQRGKARGKARGIILTEKTLQG